MKLSICALFLVVSAFAQQQTYSFSAPPPPAVSGVSAQASQTGLGNYCWWVVGTYAIGNAPPSSPVCLSNVGGTVTVRWSSSGSGLTYAVLRTSGPTLPSGTANIAVATAISGTSQTDSLGALSSYTVSTAGPATANIILDNVNHGTPGLYQNVNSGAYTPLGSGGSGITNLTTGTGNPNAGAVACTAPSSTNLSYYWDTAVSSTGLWFCFANNQWKNILTSIGSGAYALSAATGTVNTGTAGSRPATPADGYLYCATDTHVFTQYSTITGWSAQLNGAGYAVAVYDPTLGLQVYPSNSCTPTTPTLNGPNTYTSSATIDASAAAHTIPAKVGTAASKPASCTTGEMYFATDSTAGQNWYYCTASNTWTQQLNSGGGGCGLVDVFPTSAVSTGVTTAWIANSWAPGTTEASRQWVSPCSGTISNFQIFAVTTQASGGGLQCWVDVNGAPTAITATIAASAPAGTIASDDTDTAPVALHNLLSVKCTNSSTAGVSAVPHITFRIQ